MLADAAGKGLLTPLTRFSYNCIRVIHAPLSNHILKSPN